MHLRRPQRQSYHLFFLILLVSFFLQRSTSAEAFTTTTTTTPTTTWRSFCRSPQGIALGRMSTTTLRGGGGGGGGADGADRDDDDDDDNNTIRVLGVCGGIGSGKSTVCKLLVSDFGCIGHIEADRLAHEVYRPHSPVLRELADAFGNHLIEEEDGSLNRPALGKVVFGNPQAMLRLERIVWPHVKELVQARIQELKDSYCKKRKTASSSSSPTGPPLAVVEKSNERQQPIIIVEAAVLLDAGWHEFQDGVWVVKVSPQVALERLQSERGMTHDEALQRIEAQESRRGMKNLQDEIQNGVVTGVVDNSGDLEALKKGLREKLGDDKAWYAATSSNTKANTTT